MSADKVKTTLIHSLNEIPATFASEDDERDWWATHEFSEELYETLRDYSDDHQRLLKKLKNKARVDTPRT
jgi:gas vesicle protein